MRKAIDQFFRQLPCFFMGHEPVRYMTKGGYICGRCGCWIK